MAHLPDLPQLREVMGGAALLLLAGCSSIDVHRLPDGWLRADAPTRGVAADFPPGAPVREWTDDGGVYEIDQVAFDKYSPASPTEWEAEITFAVGATTLAEWRNSVHNNSRTEPAFDVATAATVCGAPARAQTATVPSETLHVIGRDRRGNLFEREAYLSGYFHRAVEFVHRGRSIVARWKVRQERRDRAAEERFFVSLRCW